MTRQSDKFKRKLAVLFVNFDCIPQKQPQCNGQFRLFVDELL